MRIAGHAHALGGAGEDHVAGVTSCTRSPLSGLSPGPARAPTPPDSAQTDVFANTFDGSAGDSEKI